MHYISSFTKHPAIFLKRKTFYIRIDNIFKKSIIQHAFFLKVLHSKYKSNRLCRGDFREPNLLTQSKIKVLLYLQVDSKISLIALISKNSKEFYCVLYLAQIFLRKTRQILSKSY